ncbi:hypothetical protein LIA77_05679 [Sarocladium implicatum]|nr:hypothetical protein LIA77_05679 [Sarocladium implicatum]
MLGYREPRPLTTKHNHITDLAKSISTSFRSSDAYTGGCATYNLTRRFASDYFSRRVAEESWCTTISTTITDEHEHGITTFADDLRLLEASRSGLVQQRSGTSFN